MDSITIYTTGPLCGRCNALKAALTMAGYTYQEADMTTSESRAAMMTGGCFSLEAPVLQIDDRFYGPELFPYTYPTGNGTMLDTTKLKSLLEGDAIEQPTFSGTGGQPSGKVQKCDSIWRD